MLQLEKIKCFLLDMDGTLYLGNQLIEGALDFLDLLAKQNKEYIFLTNNSSKSSKDYQKKLKKLGIDTPLKNIINSGEVTANYIKKQNENAKVYVVGTPSLEKELEDYGLTLVSDKDNEVDYLVLGFDTTLNYQKLWDAHDLILDGIPYIATNPDYVCPLAGGKTMPDCGAMISLLKTSTGKEPLVIGKPNVLMIDYVAEKLDLEKDEIAMVGDRLYTDIQTAINAEITSILVLSGETDNKLLDESPQKPDFVLPSIKELKEKLQSE